MKGQPFKRILGVLKTVAPTAVAALGGPFGPLIAGTMKQVMGNEAMSDADLEDSVLRAASSPADFVKLKEIEAAAKAREADLGVRFAELEVEDRQGARQLAVATSILPQAILSGLYTFGYFWVLWLYLTGRVAEMPPEQSAMTTTLAGALTAVQVQILNFWFGSSKSSQEKTAILGAR